MSRLDDLLDLIQTTNEVYFITAPGRIRTAYILVDDIVELALKSYLQVCTFQQRENCLAALESAGWLTSDKHRTAFQRFCEEEIPIADLPGRLGRNDPGALATLQGLIAAYDRLQHWSANDPNARKEFADVVGELRTLQAGSPTVLDLLSNVLARRTTRNKFFHDHQQSGLTVDDDKCLRALCDLFSLMEALFPEFRSRVQAHQVVRCQMGVLRLKLAASGSSDIVDAYNHALQEFGNQTLTRWSGNFEHSVLHTISDRFFKGLRLQFQDAIAKLEVRIGELQRMKHPNERQRHELADTLQRATSLSQQLREIEALLGP